MKKLFKLAVAAVSVAMIFSLAACLNSGRSKYDAKVSGADFEKAVAAAQLFPNIFSDDMWGYVTSAEKNYKMTFSTDNGSFNGYNYLILVRDGNKACVCFNNYGYYDYSLTDGNAIYLTYNYNDNTFDRKVGREDWVCDGKMTQSVKRFLPDTAYTALNLGVAPITLDGTDVTYKDFTYDAKNRAYFTEKTLTEDELVIKDISLKFQDKKITEFVCTCEMLGLSLPIKTAFSYNERGDLEKTVAEQNYEHDGAVISTKMEITMYYDELHLLYDDLHRVVRCTCHITSEADGESVVDATSSVSVLYDQATLTYPEYR